MLVRVAPCICLQWPQNSRLLCQLSLRATDHAHTTPSPPTHQVFEDTKGEGADGRLLEMSLGSTQALVHPTVLARAGRGTVCFAALRSEPVSQGAATATATSAATTAPLPNVSSSQCEVAGQSNTVVVVDLIAACAPYVRDEEGMDSRSSAGRPVIIVSRSLASLLDVGDGDAVLATMPHVDQPLAWLHPDEIDVEVTGGASPAILNMLVNTMVPAPTVVAAVARAQLARAVMSLPFVASGSVSTCSVLRHNVEFRVAPTTAAVSSLGLLDDVDNANTTTTSDDYGDDGQRATTVRLCRVKGSGSGDDEAAVSLRVRVVEPSAVWEFGQLGRESVIPTAHDVAHDKHPGPAQRDALDASRDGQGVVKDEDSYSGGGWDDDDDDDEWTTDEDDDGDDENDEHDSVGQHSTTSDHEGGSGHDKSGASVGGGGGNAPADGVGGGSSIGDGGGGVLHPAKHASSMDRGVGGVLHPAKHASSMDRGVNGFSFPLSKIYFVEQHREFDTISAVLCRAGHTSASHEVAVLAGPAGAGKRACVRNFADSRGLSLSEVDAPAGPSTRETLTSAADAMTPLARGRWPECVLIVDATGTPGSTRGCARVVADVRNLLLCDLE
jgi:hypothetical protein